MRLELNDGLVVICDDTHASALDEYHWRAYTHDDGLTWEVATDCYRNGKRTTMMLSRFLMSRLYGRELDDAEIVYRVKHYGPSGTLDYRDDNLKLNSLEGITP